MSQRALAIALFAVPFVYLWWFRNEGLFHMDSVFLAQAVEGIYGTGRFDTHWRFGAVLASALLYFPFWLFGENAERATILSSILFHALSIPMTFLFVERLSGSRLLGALSAGLLALAPVYTVANTFGKEYGLTVFLLVTSSYLALVAREKGSAVRAGASGLIFAFGYIVWEGLLALTPIYALVWLAPGRPLLGTKPLKVGIGALVGFGLGLVFDIATSLHAIIQTYATSSGMTGFAGVLSKALPMAFYDLAYFLGPLFVIASAMGFVIALRKRWYPILIVAVPLVASVGFYGNLSTYGPRYLAFCALGLAIFGGVGLQFLILRGPRLRGAAIVGSGLILVWMVAVSYPLLAPRHRYNGAKQFALFVAEKTEPESMIVVMDDSRFIQYYGRRATMGHPVDDQQATDRWVEQLKEMLTQRPVYMVSSALSYDNFGIFAKAIVTQFSMELVGEKTTEAFHHAERKLQFYKGRIFRLRLKPAPAPGTQ